MYQSWGEPGEQFCSTNGWRRGSVEVYTRRDGLSPKFQSPRPRLVSAREAPCGVERSVILRRARSPDGNQTKPWDGPRDGGGGGEGVGL